MKMNYSNTLNETSTHIKHFTTSSPTSAAVDSTKTALNVAYIAGGVFGIVGNLVALIVIFTHKPLRKRLSNYFFINKTIVDLIVCVMLIPTFVPTYTKINYVFCLLWSSKAIFLGIYMTSVYSIVLLAFERFLEVVYPIKHRLNVTKTKVLVSIAIAWAIGFGEKFALLMSPVTWTESGGCVNLYPSANVKMAAGIMNFLSEYCLPLILIWMCYIFMAVSLHNKAKVHDRPGPGIGVRESGGIRGPDVVHGPGGGTRGPDVVRGPGGGRSRTVFGLSRAKKNILITLIIIVAFFVALNTYKHCLLVLSYSGYSYLYTPFQFTLAQILSFLNATIDPYIYLVSHKEFRTGVSKLFRCGRKATKEESDETVIKNTVPVFAVKPASVNPISFTALPAGSLPSKVSGGQM